MTSLRLLAVAVNSQRMGYVLFRGRELKEWRAMTKPTHSQLHAAESLQRLINEFRPEIVVTEAPKATPQSQAKTQLIKGALRRTAAQNFLLDVNVNRPRNFANKYEEAAAFGAQYPELLHLVPPVRRAFDHQPARLIIFDAIALAHEVLDRPTQRLAAALG